MANQLVDYVAKKREANHTSECWLCSIPERKFVDEVLAYRGDRGHPLHCSTTEIVDFLVNKCGHPADIATKARIEKHYERRHHAEK